MNSTWIAEHVPVSVNVNFPHRFFFSCARTNWICVHRWKRVHEAILLAAISAFHQLAHNSLWKLKTCDKMHVFSSFFLCGLFILFFIERNVWNLSNGNRWMGSIGWRIFCCLFRKNCRSKVHYQKFQFEMNKWKLIEIKKFSVFQNVTKIEPSKLSKH